MNILKHWEGKMEYTVEDIIKDLNSDKAWNEIREQMIASGLNKKVMDDSTKKELSEAVNQYFYRKCPQEYKDNPHIHYEVRMKKDTTSQ